MATKRENKELLPAVAELIEAHRAAFDDDFKVLRCIDFTTNRRRALKNCHQYEFPKEVLASMKE
jgi:thiazole synthase ThiGH ThiG subunit